jgi:hypothetical protein
MHSHSNVSSIDRATTSNAFRYGVYYYKIKLTPSGIYYKIKLTSHSYKFKPSLPQPERPDMTDLALSSGGKTTAVP